MAFHGCFPMDSVVIKVPNRRGLTIAPLYACDDWMRVRIQDRAREGKEFGGSGSQWSIFVYSVDELIEFPDGFFGLYRYFAGGEGTHVSFSKGGEERRACWRIGQEEVWRRKDIKRTDLEEVYVSHVCMKRSAGDLPPR
jgi:hypothetical protein